MGLTRLEMFSGMAMQSIIENQDWYKTVVSQMTNDISLTKIISIIAIDMAVELENQLEERKVNGKL